MTSCTTEPLVDATQNTPARSPKTHRLLHVFVATAGRAEETFARFVSACVQLRGAQADVHNFI